MPDFWKADGTPPRANRRLATYGRCADARPVAVNLVEIIREWQSTAPAQIAALRTTGSADDGRMADALERNAAARVAWCKAFEDAIAVNDAEFFETVATVLRQKANGGNAHHTEAVVWGEFQKLCNSLHRLPTKKEVRGAVGKRHVTVTNWDRVFKHLDLQNLPKDKGGAPRK